MLRIVFTAEDLTRVTFRRFALWPETVLSLGLLHGSEPAAPSPLRAWRRAVTAALARHRLVPDVLRLGGTLSPGESYEGTGYGGTESGRARLLAQYQRLAIEPYRDRIDAAIADDLRHHGQLILHGGYAASLAELAGEARWSGTVLTLPHPTPVTLRLSGRGLPLQPSYFCPPDRTLLLGSPERPVLLYPVQQRPGGPAAAPGGRGTAAVAPLFGPLLGRTRAQVLPLLLDGGCSTTALAERLEVSPATASQHASALRDMGLVTTVRRGREVEHRLTPFALRLLDTCC
ncbi:helix-turn-helix domain-containing protein [Streptomyces coeruleoprunus]|uniref:Helix-turn-helix domain-containing protein n=1 Tax=Streptomyces coeruleoprunus TaxID=285563 RepID=A0ABV9XPP8_9ACTN